MLCGTLPSCRHSREPGKTEAKAEVSRNGHPEMRVPLGPRVREGDENRATPSFPRMRESSEGDENRATPSFPRMRESSEADENPEPKWGFMGSSVRTRCWTATSQFDKLLSLPCMASWGPLPMMLLLSDRFNGPRLASGVGS